MLGKDLGIFCGALKTRNFVVRVGDDLSTHGELPHVQAVDVFRQIRLIRLSRLEGLVLDALSDQLFSLCMQGQGNSQSFGRALPGVVIRRCTDATTREHDVSTLEGALKNELNSLWVIPNVFRVRQRKAPLREQFNRFGHVLVSTLAR